MSHPSCRIFKQGLMAFLTLLQAYPSISPLIYTPSQRLPSLQINSTSPNSPRLDPPTTSALPSLKIHIQPQIKTMIFEGMLHKKDNAISRANDCIAEPLKPSLWRELRMNDYLTQYPGGDKMDLEVCLSILLEKSTWEFLITEALVETHFFFFVDTLTYLVDFDD